VCAVLGIGGVLHIIASRALRLQVEEFGDGYSWVCSAAEAL
jgi:hypothetical protein